MGTQILSWCFDIFNVGYLSLGLVWLLQLLSLHLHSSQLEVEKGKQGVPHFLTDIARSCKYDFHSYLIGSNEITGVL